MTNSTSNTITLIQPDDWHIHLRDGAALARTVNDAARQFNRAIVMPNLAPPVTSAHDAAAYKQRIENALQADLQFEPLMVLYLTDNTDAKTVAEAKASGIVHAFKWYPAGATTNSNAGVTAYQKIRPALEAMQAHNMVLSVHGEVTDAQIDIFDRESHFIDQTLTQVIRDFPDLRIVFEHITTRNAVDFVRDNTRNLAATITPQHLLFNRNQLLAGGIRPHYYCLPILKRKEHQQSLINAATSGEPQFFLGTDSAPHSQDAKESACGCAGSYSAYSAIELYAKVFEKEHALDKLENFASCYGADFYQLPRNTTAITLKRNEWQIPSSLKMASDSLIPLAAGETLDWKLETKNALLAEQDTH